MIVCVCNALREGACREAACRPECRGPGCVYRMLGAQVRCGRCLPQMRGLVAEAKASCPAASTAAAPASAAAR